MARARSPLRGAALVAEARAVLTAAPCGLLTDLDGTLSPIVPTPELARVALGARRSLRALVRELALVAVLTGRSAAGARRMLRVPGVTYVGNHGMEALVGRRRWTHPDAARAAPAIAGVLGALPASLGRDDVRYEPKGLTASVHYRGARDPEAARAAILAALAALPEAAALRITEGRQVVELRPPVDATKGTAAACLLRRAELRAALFLGDDRTDLDAVRALHAARARGVRTLAVAVASAESPPELLAEADGVVESVAAVAELLAALAVSG
jgi:trehalose 6-phosphate phosphatase